ncbi:MAG: Flp pilus assembly complex ATPase component TadA [Armatimonadetes bacterium]|nr:Flp pilus assembly complex ATPase component TadA [Armatimonadota bacterium]
MPRVSMVQFLVQKGYLKQDQFEEARKVQDQTKNPDFGQVLIDLGFVGEREVLQGKAQEAGIGFVDLDNTTPESSALNVVPEKVAKSHRLIPVKKDNNTLYVALTDYRNIQAIDAVQAASGLRVIPVLAVPEAIDNAIRQNYGGSNGSAGSNGAAKGAAAAATKAPVPAETGSSVQNFNKDMRAAIAEFGVSRGSQTDEEDEKAGAELADQAPIIKLANALIQQAITDRASDIHVEPQPKSVRVRYRVDGVLEEAMTVPRNLLAPLVSRLKIMADMNIAERRIPQDGRIEVRHNNKELDLRVNSIPTPNGEKIVMRILDKSGTQIGLEKLGFLPENQVKIEEMSSQPNGLFLCTGPTGSGKTTTLYSVLNKLNQVGVNIVTAEDPVEYQLQGINQVGMNRKAGLTFATALRAFLRQDPDIIMVGEIRDLETAEIAIESSLTGHLVLSTLHTNDAPSATLRLIDMGVEPYLIAATLMGVLAQRLARRIDPDSREPYTVKAIELRKFGMTMENPEEDVTLYRGIPRPENRDTGYRGRTGIHELLTMNAEIAELVVRRAPLNDIKAAAKANGMKELREDGLIKVLRGDTDPEEVMRVVFTAGY